MFGRGTRQRPTGSGASQSLARAGRRHLHAARESFDRGLDAYKRLGAGQAWIDALLDSRARLIAVRSQRAPPRYPDGLTEREGEVLKLIAAGRSNREIAGELVVSIRTVERHITNIYAKIGARGKADATAYALRHALT